MMGAQAWLRAFTTPGGFFVWLPQAVMWNKAKNGNTNAAKRFIKNTRWWVQIGGWFFTLSALSGSTYLFYPSIFEFSTSTTINFLLLNSHATTTETSETLSTCTNTNYDSYWGVTYRDSRYYGCSAYYSD